MVDRLRRPDQRPRTRPGPSITWSPFAASRTVLSAECTPYEAVDQCSSSALSTQPLEHCAVGPSPRPRRPGDGRLFRACSASTMAIKFHHPDFLTDRAVADLGPAPLRPHAGHLLRLARQRLFGVHVLRRAAAGRAAGHEPRAGLAPVRRLEFRPGHSRLGPGADRRQPAAGMGRIPAGRRRRRRLRVCF